MLLKSRLYYVLFVTALVMMALAVIILFVTMPSGRTTTISEIGVPLAELPLSESSSDGDSSSSAEFNGLILYPEGAAPSAELKFDPVPFSDLLPQSDAGSVPLDSENP